MAEIKYLEINADDRSIIIPEGENLLGVENDNKGVRKYFICPKIVGDNGRLYQCAECIWRQCND